MDDLNSEQLDAIQRLLIEPVREAVRQEVRLSHQKLAAAIDKLEVRVAQRLTDQERRLTIVERSSVQFRTFRNRIVAVYGALTLILSLAWSVLRDRLMSRFK